MNLFPFPPSKKLTPLNAHFSFTKKPQNPDRALGNPRQPALQSPQNISSHLFLFLQENPLLLNPPLHLPRSAFGLPSAIPHPSWAHPPDSPPEYPRGKILPTYRFVAQPSKRTLHQQLLPLQEPNRPHPSSIRDTALFMYQHDQNSVFRHSPPIKLHLFRIARKLCSPQLSSDG